MDVKAYIKNCLEELELNYDYDEVSEVFHLVMATDLLNITVRFRALDDGRRLASWAWMDFGIPKEKCVAVLQFLNRKFSENYYYAHYYLLEDDRHVVFEYVCPVWDTMDVEVFRTPNHSECIRCGDCVAACPHGAITRTFSLKTAQKTKETIT